MQIYYNLHPKHEREVLRGVFVYEGEKLSEHFCGEFQHFQ